MRFLTRTRLFACLAALVLPLSVNAGSFSLSEQSASGLGTAFASGAAQADDASTLFFNPAGIVRLDQGEVQFGIHLIVPSADFNNQGSRYVLPGTPFNNAPISGPNGRDAGVTREIPNFYLTQPVFRNTAYGDLSVGLGVTVPFGLETSYGPGWVGRYQALRTKLSTFDIQPTVAYRIFDRLSFGAGLDIQYASARLTQAIDFGLIAQPLLGQFYAQVPAAARAATQAAYLNAGFAPGRRDGVSEVTGNDWSVGFTLGALLEYWKGEEEACLQDGRFGVSFRSGIDHVLEGDGDFRGVPIITAPGAPAQFPQPGALQSVFFNQNATAALDLPEILHFSIYQRFYRQFAILGDISWTHWSRLQTVPIVFSNPGTPASVLQINYDDALRYAAGFEYYPTKRLTFRTGFAYDETPIASPAFRTPRIPDNNRYFLSAGLRWSVTESMDVDLGYAHLFVDSPSTRQTDTQGHQLLGTYDASVDIVSASLTYKWGGRREMREAMGKDSGSYRK